MNAVRGKSRLAANPFVGNDQAVRAGRPILGLAVLVLVFFYWLRPGRPAIGQDCGLVFRNAQKRREMYSRIWCFQYGQSWPPSGPQLSREWRMPLLARISERRYDGPEFSHWPVPVAM